MSMSECAKCLHPFAEHDFGNIDNYGACTHQGCICSHYEPSNPCDCETCEKHRRRYD